MIKKGMLTVIVAVLMMTPLAVEGKTVNRYTTQTVTLKSQTEKLKVNRNTKLKITKQGKTWATVKCGSGTYKLKKRYLSKLRAVKKYTGRYLKRAGRIRWRGYSYTWYSQRTMPGGGLKIPGRHVDSQGYVCDKDNYIVVGSSVANKRKKLIVVTPFGKFGKCYDCGYVGSQHFDVYTAW